MAHIWTQTASWRAPLQQRWSALPARRQRLYLVLLAAGVFHMLVQRVWAPQRAATQRLQRELSTLQKRAESLRAELPDLTSEQQLLGAAQRSLERLQKDLAALEGQLPRQSSLPELLGQLASQAGGYPVEFTSVKPTTKKAGADDPYARLEIEVKFLAQYPHTVNVLKRLEQVSPFLDVTAVTLEEAKDGGSKEAAVTALLATVLGSTSDQPPPPLAPAVVEPVQLPRDPFIIKRFPGKQSPLAQLTLNGITPRGARSTAIINDTVVGIGDVLGDYQVMQVMPTMVVLSDGRESMVLSLEQTIEKGAAQ